MLQPSDPFYSSLKAILEGRCNPTVLSPTKEIVNSPQESPLTFHDRHLAKDLALEQIIALPLLHQSLSKLCEAAVEAFLQSGHKFQPYGNNLVPGVPHRPVHTAAVFIFDDDSIRDNPFALHGWLQISYNATWKKMYFTDKLDVFLDPALKDKLEDLARRYPELALWQIFGRSPLALRLLKSVERDRKFSWEVPRTGGARTNAKTQRSRDANLGASGFQLTYNQAWARATLKDATFIIFNCGSHERVGIRHRETQTLFLSEPIDTVRVGYRKCHIGLYLAIVHDVLERQKMAKEEETATTTLKRTQDCLDDKEEVATKRRKTSAPPPAEDFE
ncbi:hypothetical protein NLJ89_g9083 [Agrocybe chaxingu]|uniref:Uncharacterized protein n=1 Tax=Agrocybe chaxingu TaxID=84603 RepID=A0A9W8MTW1_9AGAR|nr:hypothetical protein NLJ89_g9083 [Agrocybe chaxingu]